MAWEQLQSIYRLNAEELLLAEATPMTDCPLCGTTLDAVRGILHCPFGDWQSEMEVR